jgi:hypothetical protein
LWEKFEGLEEEAALAEERAEVAEEENEVLRQVAGADAPSRGRDTGVELGSSEDLKPHLPLWMMLSKNSETHPQDDVVGLGFSLMAQQLYSGVSTHQS